MWSAASPSATEVGRLGRAQDRGFQFPDIHVVVGVATIPSAQGHMLRSALRTVSTTPPKTVPVLTAPNRGR
jgi:hypothetical protein